MNYIYGNGGTAFNIIDFLFKGMSQDITLIYDHQGCRVPKDITQIDYDSFLKSSKKSDNVYIGIGNIKNRSVIFKTLLSQGINCQNLIDKSAIIASSAILKKGTLIFPYSIICSNVVIGENVFMNNQCVVGHDVQIGNHCVLAANVIIGSNSIIGENTFIGIGAKIKNNIKIGKNCFIGMGSIITRDIPDNTKLTV